MKKSWNLLMQVEVSAKYDEKFLGLIMGDSDEERAEFVQSAVRNALFFLNPSTTGLCVSRQPEVQP